MVSFCFAFFFSLFVFLSSYFLILLPSVGTVVSKLDPTDQIALLSICDASINPPGPILFETVLVS